MAGELANLTGETLTRAITVALKERLERQRRQLEVEARVSGLDDIGKRCAGYLGDGPSAVEHGDYLYDRDGLPR